MLETSLYLNILYIIVWFTVGAILSSSVYLFRPTRKVFVTNTEDKIIGGCFVVLFSLLGVFAVLLPLVSYYYTRLKTKSAIQ